MRNLYQKLIIIGLILFNAHQASAFSYYMDKFGGSTDGTTKFNTLIGSQSSNATEDNVTTLWPTTGTFRNFKFYSSVAPGGASKTLTMTLRINAADTGITCTITNAATTCVSSTEVSVSAGDRVSYSQTSANTPAVTTLRTFIQFEPSNRNESVFSGSTGVTDLATTGTNFTTLSSIGNYSTTENNTVSLIGTAGTFKKLYVRVPTAPGALTSFIFTVRKNGADTALTCTITGAAQTTCSDTSDSFTVAVGDLVTLEQTDSGVPISTDVGQYGAVFVSNIDGESLWEVSDTGNMNTGVISYTGVQTGTAWNTTTGRADEKCDNYFIKAMYVNEFTAPDTGAGVQQYTYTLRKNGSSVAMTCVIADANTTCNDTTHTIQIVLNDLLEIGSTPSGTPTASSAILSFVVFTTPRRIW